MVRGGRARGRGGGGRILSSASPARGDGQPYVRVAFSQSDVRDHDYWSDRKERFKSVYCHKSSCHLDSLSVCVVIEA